MSSLRRNQRDPSRSSDPAMVGLCRAMIGLSLVLVVGLMVLGWATLKSGIDWDASVVRMNRDHGEGEVSAEFDPGIDASGSMSNAIRIDLDQLNSEGLLGSEDGLRALSYEFCIPAVDAYVQDVKAIDSTVAIQGSSPGRIGCGGAEYLAIGHTHQAGFREVLDRLSRLPYVSQIQEAHFE